MFSVIAASVLILMWRLSDSYTFANDDLLQFDVANRAGLGSELLLLNVFSHFAPFNRFFHWVLLNSELNPAVGIWIAGVLVAGLLVATAWLTYELGMPLVRRLLVLVATGGSLSVLESAVWNDAVFHILPALTATYLVIAMHVRGIRTGRTRWHVASVAVFALGLLIQERTAFALPLAILFDVLLYWRDLPVRQRFRELWSVRRPLAAMGAIGAVAAYLIQQNYATDYGSPPPLLAIRTALLALTNYQFPQLFGYQPSSTLGLLQQLLVLVVIVGVSVLLIAWNRRNIGPVLLLFSVFALYWGFLAFSPILFEDSVAETAERLHNAAYVTIPAYVSLFSLSASARVSHELRARFRPWSGAASWAAVALLLIAVTIAGSIFTSAHWAPYRSAHAFWEGVRASAPLWSDPNKTVLPLQGPEGVANAWAPPLGRLDLMLPFVKDGWSPGALTDQPIIVTGTGEVRDARLQVVSTTTRVYPHGATEPSSTQPWCLASTSPNDSFSFLVDRPSTIGPLMARISYTSESSNTVRAVAMPGPKPSAATGVPAGSHDMLLPLGTQKVHWLRINSMHPGSTMCVHSLDIVRAVGMQPDGRCWLLDPNGNKTDLSTDCGGLPTDGSWG